MLVEDYSLALFSRQNDPLRSQLYRILVFLIRPEISTLQVSNGGLIKLFYETPIFILPSDQGYISFHHNQPSWCSDVAPRDAENFAKILVKNLVYYGRHYHYSAQNMRLFFRDCKTFMISPKKANFWHIYAKWPKF